MKRKLAGYALAGLILAAGGLGLHLGQSAIAQINPLYYQGAAVHPRDRGAVFDESRLPPQAPRFAELYGWEEGAAARGADCGDCGALGARDAFYESGVRYAVAETDWRIQPVVYAVQAEPQPEAVPEEQAPAEPEPVDVARYASFPIEEKPAEIEQPIELAAAAK